MQPTLKSQSFLQERICASVDGPARRVGNTPLHFVANNLYHPTILQFGVLKGRSLDSIGKVSEYQATLWGFDSFVGLPESEGAFRRGAYSATFRTRNRTLQQARIRQIVNRISNRIPGKVHIVPGLYTQSLTHTLGMRLSQDGPAAYIDVDCDLYTSTFHALDWSFSHGLASTGTMIGYDDWWVLPCTVPRDKRQVSLARLGGEARAHFEIAQKYRVSFECVCGPCSSESDLRYGWRTYYRVRNFSAMDAGFAMNASVVQRFMATNKGCLAHASRANV